MSGETFSPHDEYLEMNFTENKNFVHETPEGQISHEEFAGKLTELNQMNEQKRAERINDILRWRIEEQEGKPIDIERELNYSGWSMRNLESLVRHHSAVRDAQEREKQGEEKKKGK